MVYTATYSTVDFQEMIVDLMGTILNVIIANIGLVVFLVIITLVIVRFSGALRALLGTIRF